MSVDLFCYSTRSVIATNSILEALRSARSDLFSDKFIISAANEINQIGAEIAWEFELKAISTFVVGLNDKSQAARLQEVAGLIKAEFGEAAVVVLRNNEDLM